MKTQEETDRLEREKFGSGHLISGDGNRRYILKKEDQKDESADDDLSWLNDDSEDESRLPKKSIHPENPNSPLRSKKRARVVSDESESENEGGFFKPHSPKAQIHNGITPTKQWMCPSCTLYNDMADSICSMCGHSSSMPFAAPSSNSHPESFDKEEIEVLETPPSAVSEPQEPNNNQNFVEEESALKSNSQSSDEWEDNHYENVLEDTCEKNDESVDPTPPQQCLNEDIITRAVLSASNMGDWAGRAVRRALQANNPQSTRVVPSEKDTVSNVEVDSHHPTNELQNLFGPTQHELTADGGFMREGANERVVQSNDNGFEVDELEFERKALRDVDVGIISGGIIQLYRYSMMAWSMISKHSSMHSTFRISPPLLKLKLNVLSLKW